MAHTWLMPNGDMSRVMDACRIPDSDRMKPEVLDKVELAAQVACSIVEDGWEQDGNMSRGCGPIAPTGEEPVPAWATAAGLIIAEHYYRTRLGATRTNSSPGDGMGFLVPNAAIALLTPHELKVGFA